MEVLQTLVPLIFAFSLAALVLSVGLDAEVEDVFYLVRRPGQLAKALLAVNVIVPLAAVLILALLPGVSLVATAGILMMAVSPVPPLVPGKEIKAGGRKPYAYSLYATLIVLAVLIVPLSVWIMARIYGVSVSLPVALVVRNVALTVLLPLGIGLLVRRFKPGFATRALPLIRTAATVALVIALVPILIRVGPAMVGLVGDGTVLAMALIVSVALAAGHLLGGPDPQDRAALAVTAATRHPGIALMIVSTNAMDKHITAAIIGFLLVSVIVGLAYQLWAKRRGGAAAAAA